MAGYEGAAWMVRSVCDVARYTKMCITCNVLIYVVFMENCDILHLCGPEGARYCNFNFTIPQFWYNVQL